LEALEEILPGEEPELRGRLRDYLTEEGMKVITGARVFEVQKDVEGVRVLIEEDEKETAVEGTHLLVATGRSPNTDELNLEGAGVQRNEKGFIKTDEYMKTSSPNIYAAGDCVGRMMLVTVAAYEGSVAATNALKGDIKKVDYLSVPHAVFTDPQMASVGLTQEVANKMGFDVDFRVLEFKMVPRAIISGEDKGLVKVISDKRTGTILGVHILGPYAAEIIHRAVPAVKYRLKIEEFLELIDVYPTFSEAVKLCVQSFQHDIRKLSCCAQ
jgi:mercuric reductase